MRHYTSVDALRDVVFASGRFVAVGYNGTILTSPNGVNWTVEAAGTQQVFTSVAFGNNTMIAADFTGASLRSTGGGLWIPGQSPIGVSEIAYGNGLFVAVGRNGMISTSPDGVTWSTQASGVTSTLNDVTFAKGRFMAVGNLGVLLDSTNGVRWTAQNLGISEDLLAIGKSDNDTIVIGGGNRGFPGPSSILRSSSDGVSWQVRLSPSRFAISKIGYGGGRFIALAKESLSAGSRTHLFWSEDAERWQSAGMPSALRGVVYGNDQFVAVGNNGTILSSPDGAVWIEQASPTAAHLAAVEFAAGFFVAVGQSGTILSSADAVNWTSRRSGTNLDLSGVIYGNGLFVAVGGKSIPGDQSVSLDEAVVVTSADGSLWTVQKSARNEGHPTDVAYGNGRFVSTGDFTVKISPGLFANFKLDSTDGVSWTRVPFEVAPTAFPKVVFGNGLFVALGTFNGELALSSNGWAQTSIGAEVLGLAFGQRIFLATGRGAVFSSTDAVTWNRRNVGLNAALWDGAFGRNTFVVVGEGETILQSDVLHSESGVLLADPRIVRGQFQVTVPTVTGKRHILESKENLEQPVWATVATILGTGVTLTLADPSPTDRQRFYRLRTE